MSSSPAPRDGDDSDVDAKTQIAQQIFDALMRDAATELAFRVHNQEAQHRRRVARSEARAAAEAEAAAAAAAAAATAEASTSESKSTESAAAEEGESAGQQENKGQEDGEEEEGAVTEADSTFTAAPQLNLPSGSGSGSARATPGINTPMRGTPIPTFSTPTQRDASNLITSTYSANPLIRCLACNRHVASNRYAPHLAKCMGLGASSGSKAGAGSKRKAAAHAVLERAKIGRGSPYTPD